MEAHAQQQSERCMSSPHHHRRLPETLEKAKSACTKVHTTPAAKKQRENTASSQLGHCSSEHMIAVVILICVNMSVSPRENAIETSLSTVWSVAHQNSCADEFSKHCKFNLRPQFTEHERLAIPIANCCLQSNR